MKIRLVKPLPQPELGKVIPAGIVIDAPPALYRRLLKAGMGTPYPPAEAPVSAAETPGTKPAGRKKVKRRG